MRGFFFAFLEKNIILHNIILARSWKATVPGQTDLHERRRRIWQYIVII